MVLDVCISSDGVLCVTASDDFSARVWDLDEDGEQLHVLERHGGWVTSCAFIGTTQRVITASHVSAVRGLGYSVSCPVLGCCGRPGVTLSAVCPSPAP